MAKPEWGVKRTCHNCGARFYDLCREPIVCPVCSTVYDAERQTRVRRGGTALKEEAGSRPKPAKRAAAGEEADDLVDEADVESDADDTDDDDDGDDLADLSPEGQDLIEDTSDLGEDGDDIGEVMDHIDDDVEDKS